jgi:putative tricarboxylic transport membrane protein
VPSLLLPTRVAVVLLSTLAVVFAVGAYRLGFWNDEMPGPGLLPFAAAALLLPLLAVVWRECVPEEEPFRGSPLAATALTCAYAAVLPYAGFLLPTVILVVTWVRMFHRQGWGRAVLLGTGLTALATILFAVLLKVPMPLWPGRS